MTIHSPADLIPFLVIGTAMLGGILWLIRAQVSLLREFRPNGGGSTKDALDRIEMDVRDMRARLDNHVDNHGRAA